MTHDDDRLQSTGKKTLILQGRDPVFGSRGSYRIKVTVLGPPEQNGFSKDGAWSLYDGKGYSPHYVLPVRKYRKKHTTAFWVGFVQDVIDGWTDRSPEPIGERVEEKRV